jgi:hypothetical protein
LKCGQSAELEPKLAMLEHGSLSETERILVNYKEVAFFVGLRYSPLPMATWIFCSKKIIYDLRRKFLKEIGTKTMSKLVFTGFWTPNIVIEQTGRFWIYSDCYYYQYINWNQPLYLCTNININWRKHLLPIRKMKCANIYFEIIYSIFMASKYTELYMITYAQLKSVKIKDIKFPLKGRNTVVTWRCDCMNEYTTEFRAIERKNSNTCKLCTNVNTRKEDNRTNTKYWAEQKQRKWQIIRETFEEANCILISDINDFVNRDTKLNYQCYCGGQGLTSWRQFQRGSRCPNHTLEKRIQTTKTKYGVENVSQCEKVKQKCKNTNKEKYGAEYCSQNKDVVAKAVNTNKKNHNGQHNFSTKLIRDQAIESHIEKYGCKPGNNEFMKKKMMEKYGVEHCMQDPEIFQRAQKNGYKLKEHKLPSGKIIWIRGYEGICIDHLILVEKIPEEEISVNNSEMPEIWYPFDNEEKRYHPDIYISSKKLFVEAKSVYTFENDKRKNLAKWRTVCINYPDHKLEVYIYSDKKKISERWYYAHNKPIFIVEY